MDTRSAVLIALVLVANSALGQCPPAAPGGVTASDGTQCLGVFIDWNAVSGATSYQVWRNTTNNYQTSTLVGTGFDTQMTDWTALPGELYYYWVRPFRALCLGNNYGPPGGPATGWAAGTTPTPSGLTASDGTVCLGVYLSWNDAPGSPLFEVYRNTVDNYQTSGLVGTSFNAWMNDLTALPDTTYYYWVRANAVCGASGPSNMDTGRRASDPMVPQNFRATMGQCQYVYVSWDEIPALPLVEIWRSQDNNLSNAILVGTTVQYSGWTDFTALPLEGYFYWARSLAVCGHGGHSQPAPGVRGAIPAPPINVAAAATCEGIRVSWTPSAAIPLVTGYKVLRGISGEFEMAETMAITGSNETAYVDPSAAPGTLYYYWITALNECSLLGVGTPGLWASAQTSPGPAFSQQPASIAAHEGGIATFSASASGAGSLTYQWRRDGEPVVNGGPVSGAETATLVINPVASEHSGAYTLRVSDQCASLDSDAANLTVVGTCYANCDGSSGTPRLTANDFTCFVNAYAAGSSYANCDGSGGTPQLTANDFMFRQCVCGWVSVRRWSRKKD